MRKISKNAVLVGLCCFLLLSVLTSYAQSQDVDALQGFPGRRLNYMFNQYVVPTIFKEGDDFGMFVHAKYLGEGRPIDDGRHWLGIRTLQAYKQENGHTISGMFDAYKSYDYGRNSRFEMNAAFGYGYTAKDWGFHAGLFTGVIFGKPQLDQNNFLLAEGPTSRFDEAEKIGGSLDWYAYYKFKNLAKFRAIFKNKARPDANSTENKQKTGFEVVGGSFKDLINIDYYRAENQVLFDTKLNEPVKNMLGAERFSGDGFLSKVDANIRMGVGLAGQGISEYSFAMKYNGPTWEYGLDLYKAKFTDGNLGMMLIYNIELFSDEDMGQKMRIVAFRNYTPMALELHSKSAVFIEFRMQL